MRRAQPVTLTGISVLAIPTRSGYSHPRLGCKTLVLLSRSMPRSPPIRSLNAASSPRSNSLGGFSPTLLPSSSLFSNSASLVRRSPSLATRLALVTPRAA